MKLTINTKAVLIISFFLLLLFSCRDDKQSNSYLIEAENKIKDNPQETLSFLDLIENPETMNYHNFMKYNLLRTAAKCETGQDISVDTTIYGVQKYFAQYGEGEETALSSLYAGITRHSNEDKKEALFLFKQALYEGEKNNMDLTVARSLNNIAFINYQNGGIDTALVYYKKALDRYKRIEGYEKYKMTTLRFTGIIYNLQKENDKAYNYLTEGLKLAEQTENKAFQVTFTHLLGMVFRDQSKYDLSKEYLQKALSQTKNDEEYVRICLSFIELYELTNQPDSVVHYNKLIEEKLSVIKHDFLLRGIYWSLSLQYKENKDYEKALYYSELEKQTIERIQQERQKQRIEEANQKLLLIHKNKEIRDAEIESILYAIGIVIFILFCVITLVYFILVARHQIRSEKREIEEAKAKYRIQMDNLLTLNTTYADMLLDIMEISKETIPLAKDKDKKLVISEKK